MKNSLTDGRTDGRKDGRTDDGHRVMGKALADIVSWANIQRTSTDRESPIEHMHDVANKTIVTSQSSCRISIFKTILQRKM